MEAGAVECLHSPGSKRREEDFSQKCHQFNVWGRRKRENISCERVFLGATARYQRRSETPVCSGRGSWPLKVKEVICMYLFFSFSFFFFWEVLTNKTPDRSRTPDTETVLPTGLRPTAEPDRCSDFNKGWMNEYPEQRSQIVVLLQKRRSEFSFCKQQITGYLLGLDLIITQIKEGMKERRYSHWSLKCILSAGVIL